MTAFESLEAMGYRFRLDGDRITYRIYGGDPPPGATALLSALDRAEVRRILEDRAAGYKRTEPAELREGWPPAAQLPEDIKAVYRAAVSFHKRNNVPGKDWEHICQDMKKTAQEGPNKPFLQALLMAVYEELERSNN